MKFNLTCIEGILTAILLCIYVFGIVVIMDSVIYRYFN